MPFLIAILAAAIGYMNANDNGAVPTITDMLPASTVLRVLLIIGSFAAIIAAEQLIGSFTVKATAKKEI